MLKINTEVFLKEYIDLSLKKLFTVIYIKEIVVSTIDFLTTFIPTMKSNIISHK